MAKLRDASAYRRLKRPYTRISKYRKKSFVKGVPGSKIVMYDMGAKGKSFPFQVTLHAKSDINLRHNAIEAARQTANRYLQKQLGRNGYALKLRVVPHTIMRMNALATGAGADRMQQGMRSAFGKPEGRSALVKKGKALITAYIEEQGVVHAKEALRKASSKFPIPCYNEVTKAITAAA